MLVKGESHRMERKEPDFLLTIAIPTYNRKRLLRRALESVIPQLSPKIEVLVSDNASDDGTDEMIAEDFPMVRYIKNGSNKGWDYNFLQCYREARGKYVILLGSDDRFAADSLNYLTDFLEKNDCDLIFMNYRFYDVTKKEVYFKDGEWIKNFKDKQDIVTSDRSQFMKYADHAITFISASVVKKSLLLGVREPEHFIGTNFMHTYIMLEAVKGKQALFGVVMKPLAEQNVTNGDAELSKTPDKYFTVWGKDMYSVLCEHAVECGFQRSQMKRVYLHRLQDAPFWKHILSLKRQNKQNNIVMENFWKDGYPVVKRFPSEWIKVMLVVVTPRCIINMLYKAHKVLKKGT